MLSDFIGFLLHCFIKILLISLYQILTTSRKYNIMGIVVLGLSSNNFIFQKILLFRKNNYIISIYILIRNVFSEHFDIFMQGGNYYGFI